MKRKHSLCFTVSGKHKLLSSGLGRVQTDGRKWPAVARVYENVNDGEVKS